MAIFGIIMHHRQLSLTLSSDVELASFIVQPSDPRIQNIVQKWQQAKIFGFDIETYGDQPGDALDPWRGWIRLISIALESGEVILLDFGGWEQDKEKILLSYLESGLFSILQERLENPRVLKIGHNLKFDCLWVLVHFAISVRTVRDTQLESQIYWAGILKYRHNLKEVAARVLGESIDKTEQISDFGWELSNRQRNYAASDALVTLCCHFKLWEMLKEAKLIGQAIADSMAIPGFVQMEFVGMPVDNKALEEAIVRYRQVANVVLAPFTREFPTINPSSPNQLTRALQEKYQIDLSATDADALSQHFDKPAVKALSLWRTVVKSLEYLESVAAKVEGGFVRSEYQILAPKGFGRSTSRNPNLQNPPNPGNLPKELKVYALPAVREIFRAPAGKKLIISDLSQAHARIAAQASGDRTLIEAYRQNQDVHCLTASKLAQLQGLGAEWTPEAIGKWRKDKNHPNQVTATRLRNVSKNVFYGSLNIQGWQTLQTTARTGAGIEIPDREAQQAIEAWQKTYSELYRYQRRIHTLANSSDNQLTFPGCSQTFAEVRGLSRRRIFLEKYPRFDQQFQVLVNKCKITDTCAFVWTSTEADIIKLAIAGIVAEFDKNPEWLGAIVNCAHDEIDCLVEEEYANRAAYRIDILMQGAMSIFIRDIPVTDASADYRSTIVDCWAEKE